MIRELAVAVAAGAAVLVLTVLVSDMSTGLQVLIAVGVGVIAFALGHLASRRGAVSDTSAVRVGTNIDSTGAVRISDVATGGGAEQTEVGTNIRADQDVSIDGIQVNTRKQQDG